MIDLEYIDKISNIAKLYLDETEKQSFIEHMESILDYVEILNEVDIDNEILVCNIENKAVILRNDEVDISCEKEKLLKNAPSTQNGYFLIPNIMI